MPGEVLQGVVLQPVPKVRGDVGDDDVQETHVDMAPVHIGWQGGPGEVLTIPLPETEVSQSTMGMRRGTFYMRESDRCPVELQFLQENCHILASSLNLLKTSPKYTPAGV